MTPHIGPERRKGERRSPNFDYTEWLNKNAERRTGLDSDDRRQEALANVVIGFGAEDMKIVRQLFELVDEAKRRGRNAAAAARRL